MEILYKVHNNLYVNLTNRCPYACTFCLRQTMDRIGESDRLWLEREPLAKEVIDEFAKFNMEDYDEVVFCGFGEPTEAFDVLKEVASYVKKTYNKPIRINTNGVGNLINKRDIVPEMEGIIDTVSISLNDPDKKRYNELVKCYGESYYPLDKKDYIGIQGFDCSGLTYWTYKEVSGVNIGYSTSQQQEVLKKYKVKDTLQPGDLIFTTRHVVLYIGDGYVIHSKNKYKYPTGGIKKDSVKWYKKGTAYRVIDYINDQK